MLHRYLYIIGVKKNPGNQEIVKSCFHFCHLLYKTLKCGKARIQKIWTWHSPKGFLWFHQPRILRFTEASGIFSRRFWEGHASSWLDSLFCIHHPPPNLPYLSCPQQDGNKMSLRDLSFFILHNLLSGIQVLVLCSPNKKCLSPGRRPSKQAAAGWEKRACQPQEAGRVSHSSASQPSKEWQRLPIKILLKHFWCCQQHGAEIAQWSLRCYLPQAIQ